MGILINLLIAKNFHNIGLFSVKISIFQDAIIHSELILVFQQSKTLSYLQ